MDCHAGIDPWGIPFENFDAVGLWRDEVSRPMKKRVVKSPVVSEATLPNGQTVSGIEELKAVLKTYERERFVRGLSRYMLAYGLGLWIIPTVKI